MIKMISNHAVITMAILKSSSNKSGKLLFSSELNQFSHNFCDSIRSIYRQKRRLVYQKMLKSPIKNGDYCIRFRSLLKILKPMIKE